MSIRQNSIVDKRNSLQLHMVSHKNPQFRCGICNMRITKGCDAIEHEDLHLNRSPLQCIFCDEHFERKTDVAQHVEMHVSKLCLAL